MGHRLQGWEIEGLAIVSADGMIADAAGEQPESLKLEADQRFFHERLWHAQAFVQGRHSGAVGADLAAWPRLILTRRVTGADREPDSSGRNVLWNPAGASLEQAVAALGLSGGTLAVVGGTDVFGLFLELGYDRFHLSRAGQARLPGGRPVFPGVPGASPEDLMARRGLRPGPSRVLDEVAALTLVTWLR